MTEESFVKPEESLTDRVALAFYQGYHGSLPADYDQYGASLTLHHLYKRAGITALQMLREEGLLNEDEGKVRVSEYLVLPEAITDDVDAEDYDENLLLLALDFSLRVTYQGAGKWAVYRNSQQALNAENVFDYEPSPSSRDEEYLQAHRFTRVEALRRAQEVITTMKVAGWTWADALANYRAQNG